MSRAAPDRGDPVRGWPFNNALGSMKIAIGLGASPIHPSWLLACARMKRSPHWPLLASLVVLAGCAFVRAPTEAELASLAMVR